jgi:hypothetical protein
MLTTRYQIISKIHALSATYRAVNDFLSSRLRSRNVHSEIVFSLSPNNNVCPFSSYSFQTSQNNALPCFPSQTSSQANLTCHHQDRRIIPPFRHHTHNHKPPRNQSINRNPTIHRRANTTALNLSGRRRTSTIRR